MVHIPSLGQETLWHIESHQYYQKDSPDLVRNVLFDILTHPLTEEEIQNVFQLVILIFFFQSFF